MTDYVLIVGAPGTGKTLWARAQAEEQASAELWNECAADAEYLYRAAGLKLEWCEKLDARRPFRAPHHSVSHAGMFGALQRGFRLRPGEVPAAEWQNGVKAIRNRST